jgi:PAS domain S-box-containing protein
MDNKFPSKYNMQADSEVDQHTHLGSLLARIKELEQLEQEYQSTLESLYLHQEELRTQNDELRHAQASLENARRRHQAFFDFSPVSQFLVTPNGMILKTNQAAAELLGLGPNELFNFHMPNLVGSNNHRVALLSFLETVARNKQPQPITVDLCRKNGKSVHVQLHGSRSSNSHESSVLITAVSYQHSEELETEQRLRLQAERFADALFNYSQHYIFITDPVLRLRRINPALSRLSGYGCFDLANQQLERLLYCDQYADKQWLAWQIMQAKQWQGSVLMTTQQGIQHLMQLSIHRIENNDGITEAYMGIVASM